MVNKEILRLKRTRDLWAIVTLILFFAVLIISIGAEYEINKREISNKAVTELFMFTLNVTSYCASSNNMTYQELMDDFIRNKTEELISNTKDKT